MFFCEPLSPSGGISFPLTCICLHSIMMVFLVVRLYPKQNGHRYKRCVLCSCLLSAAIPTAANDGRFVIDRLMNRTRRASQKNVFCAPRKNIKTAVMRFTIWTPLTLIWNDDVIGFQRLTPRRLKQQIKIPFLQLDLHNTLTKWIQQNQARNRCSIE